MLFLESCPPDAWVWTIWKEIFVLSIVWYLIAFLYVVAR